MVSTKLNQNHITLVPYGEKYLDATFRWINDPRVSVPFLFNRKVSKKDHLFWYNSIRNDSTQFLFAIHDKTGTHIGNLGYKFLDKDEPELWLYIGPEYQKCGFGKKAILAGVEVGIHAFNRNAIVARLTNDNIAAQKIYAYGAFEKHNTKENKLLGRTRETETILMRREKKI